MLGKKKTTKKKVLSFELSFLVQSQTSSSFFATISVLPSIRFRLANPKELSKFLIYNKKKK
jgi:hypothetical protein